MRAALLRPVQCLLRLGHLILHLVECRRGHRLAADRIASLATLDGLRDHLHAALGFRLLQIAQGLTQLRRRARLRALSRPHGLLHVLLELVEILEDLLFLFRQFLILLTRWLTFGAGLRSARPAAPVGLAHLLFKLRLTPRHFIGAIRQVGHLIAGLLTSHALQRLLSLG